MATAILGTLATISGGGIAGDILSFNGPNLSRAVIDMTHLNSPETSSGSGVYYKEKKPGSFADGGQVSVTVAINAKTTPTLGGAATEFTITWSNGETVVFDGFVSAFSISNPLEDRVTADITIEVTGIPDFGQGVGN